MMIPRPLLANGMRVGPIGRGCESRFYDLRRSARPTLAKPSVDPTDALSTRTAGRGGNC
jgi:hypothetical protein